jgi:hypothetical protein
MSACRRLISRDFFQPLHSGDPNSYHHVASLNFSASQNHHVMAFDCGQHDCIRILRWFAWANRQHRVARIS